jgi:hypothetical protein
MANIDTQRKPILFKPPMVFFYGSFQERMPLYKYLQNPIDKISYIDPNKKENHFKWTQSPLLLQFLFFGGIYITRPVIGSEQCQSETNVSGSIVEYV